MKSLQTCATKASTPLKNYKQISSISSLSNSNKRRKSMTVYSANKNVNNQAKEFQLFKEQINKQKTHLKLTSNKKKESEKKETDSISKNQETGGVIIKMNLCGPKICDVSIQNSYKFINESQTQNQRHQKKSRLLYQSKRCPSSFYQSEVNNSIEIKLNNLPIQDQKQQKYFDICPQKNVTYKTKYLGFSTPFQKIDQKYFYDQNLQKKGIQFLGQKFQDDSILVDGISNIFHRNEKKPSQKSEHTKNDSFSIRHFSSNVNFLQLSFENSSLTRGQQDFQNFEKLKQIYRKSMTSEVSSQQINHAKFSQKPLVPNFLKQDDLNLKINLKNLEEKQNAQKKQNLQKSPQISSEPNPIDSTRTIIQMLNDWDCKNDFYDFTSSNEEKISKLNENPQNLRLIKMSKKFHQ